MTLETDYLIIGSGAVGMAFADTLLSETDADIIIVDKFAKPGGHWNVAYPFVTLHQPSQFYGVSSKELSNGLIDQTGLNKGLYNLASGAEVSAYFDSVMKDTFLPSGRVKYFPLCNYKGDYQFHSMLTGQEYTVKVRKKLVDSTYLKTSVPSTHKPNFTIDNGVQFMAINDLVNITTPTKGFVIVGGGKTGIDAILWLLENNVDPNHITWIVSRDAWLIDRKVTQPTDAFFETTIGNQAKQNEAIAQSESIDDMFVRLEQAGVLVRIDSNVEPTMFHGATVSQLELVELRKIKNVIRLGRVKQIKTDQIVLDKGIIPTSIEYVHVDCSASAISNLTITDIFSDKKITPQTVRPYQPVFSASVIAYVEANFENDQKKNSLCQVVPLPNHDTDWIRMLAMQMTNQMNWSQHKGMRRWVQANRLDGFANLVKNVDRTDENKMSLLMRMKDNALPAMMKLQKYIQQMDAENKPKLEKAQFQVQKKMFFNGRLKETPAEDLTLNEGEVLIKVDKFAYTSNNITYALAGDMIGYWQFFPAVGTTSETWGVIPVWGFAEVVESKSEGIPEGDRLFGYFPPASHFKMKPVRVSDARFIDGMAHRAQLPSGYNIYRRLNNEPNYNPSFENERMLLFPLHLTSFCLWDLMQDQSWYGAEQILILSASSKTSTGLAYALKDDQNSPKVIGITSQRNLDIVNGLDLYDQSLSYDQIQSIQNMPTLIVDMSGNTKVLLGLHKLLADNMKYTINVGLTHWSDASPKPPEGLITERSEFFFAPGHIQRRIKEWGPEGFDKKTTQFIMQTAAKTKEWLNFKKLNGLEEMAAIHNDVCAGKIPANQGLIVELPK